MTFYLLEHHPSRPKGQYYRTRANTPTWAAGVHTTEQVLDRIAPDTGAENVAAFISRRPDAGSYSVVVDLDSTIQMVPDDYTTFSVAEPGYNSRTWNIAMACRVVDLDRDDPYTRLLIATVGKEIAAMWRRQGVDIAKAAYWGGTDALVRACLFNHGDVQPGDRTDAWAKHPHRATFDAWLIHDVLWHSGLVDTPEPEESEEDDDVKVTKITAQSRGALFLVRYVDGAIDSRQWISNDYDWWVAQHQPERHETNEDGSWDATLDRLPWYMGDVPGWADTPGQVDAAAIARAVVDAFPPAKLPEIDAAAIAAAVLDEAATRLQGQGR